MHSKGNLEKIGLCKTEGCPCKCKITLYGQSDQACELFFNQFEHLSLCKVEPDVFKNQSLLDLCKLNLKPSEIIREFNEKEKDNGLNISDTEENRRKISTIKYLSKCDKEEEKINNINQLQAWFDEICVEKFSGEELKLLPWDQVLVGNYVVSGNKFAAFITTKHLQLNIIKQLGIEKVCIAADGTYKLNKNGHPTIIV